MRGPSQRKHTRILLKKRKEDGKVTRNRLWETLGEKNMHREKGRKRNGHTMERYEGRLKRGESVLLF